MKKGLLVPLMMFSCLGAAALPQSDNRPPSRVDFQGFEALAAEAGGYRAQRLVNIDTFLRMAQEPGTMILDARSESAYRRKHLKNAVHLSFSDFSGAGLAQAIPSKQTRILIYCNNNISGDQSNFPEKMTPLALNIPTFINLYGYGYRNVYELSNLLSANDPKLVFEGTDI